MRAILVVNADDFGLTEGTNRAIVDAHRTGIVISTSLLANGSAFDHAVKLSHEHPSLGVGVHLTLTEGPPVADQVVGELRPYGSGDLPLSNQPFVQALVAGRLPRQAIRCEFEAQVRRVLSAGIRPTHIDGHKYIHLLPGITAIAADVARLFSIPVMRVPHRFVDSPFVVSRAARAPGLLILMLMGALAYRVARRSGLHTSDRIAGFVDTGHLDHAAIHRLINRPRPGVTELLCHPAYRTPQLDALLARGYRWIESYDFDAETAAVSDPAIRRDLEATGWQFRHFGTAFDGRPDAEASRG
jgi:chitin disaccharide deacetylase